MGGRKGAFSRKSKVIRGSVFCCGFSGMVGRNLTPWQLSVDKILLAGRRVESEGKLVCFYCHY